MKQKIHQGRNVKRFREMLGIKQEALAYALGDDWNQKKISILEQKDVIDTTILTQISTSLKIPVVAFQNFDEEQAVNIISNTFTSNDTSTINAINIQPTFNPLDKMMALFEEKEKLYERLLQAEKDKVSYLEKLLNK
ncbi:helix-turn-helix domain-containing protein [Flavobacterium tegetincola]|uniref:helix-turn-helix domain-containing protein n=1 Tax=Flavobacterium tegetincola TaxID=150172 RepID=UPI000410BC7A|nr:helix-turn-helix domain-containing protein [Flavobacterium tegetincola]